jgi:hypothetical protein
MLLSGFYNVAVAARVFFTADNSEARSAAHVAHMQMRVDAASSVHHHCAF